MNRVGDTCVLVLVKGDERYIFLFDDTNESKADTLRTFGRFAVSPELSLNLYDASVLAARLRAMTGQTK